MKFEEYKFTIAEHFVCAIINGDNTGLSDEEEAWLDAFLSQELFKRGHWGLPEGEGFFDRCDILSGHTSENYAQCIEITFWSQVEPVETENLGDLINADIEKAINEGKHITEIWEG